MPPQEPTARDRTSPAEPNEGSGPMLCWEPPPESNTPRLSVRSARDNRSSPCLELSVEGELDAGTAPALRKCLVVLAARSAGGVLVLNLAGITFCDVAGLYALLSIRQTLPLVGIDVRFTEASQVARTAATRAGLTNRLGLGPGPGPGLGLGLGGDGCPGLT